MRLVCLSVVLLVFLGVPVSAQPGPELDARNYDRVLIPVWAQHPIRGAAGSVWLTELWVRNEGDSDAWFTQIPPICIACNPDQLFKVRAHSTRVFREQDFFSSPSGGSGIFVYVEKARIQDFHFWLRVFDTSQNEDSLGTELPVIRLEEAVSTRIELIGVPLEPKFRLALRVYALNRALRRRARVKIFSADGDAVLVDQIANLGSDPTDSELHPYAQPFELLDLVGAFPQLVSAANRLRKEITPESPGLQFWGFVAVTDNETQEVTTITPQ